MKENEKELGNDELKEVSGGFDGAPLDYDWDNTCIFCGSKNIEYVNYASCYHCNDCNGDFLKEDIYKNIDLWG